MAVSIQDIAKLRKLTGAGMMDVKKALEEAVGDFEKAIELLRKRGQALAAKRSDREAEEGCILAAHEGGYAVAIEIKCETDFVAKNEDFIALAKSVLEVAKNNPEASKEELLGNRLATIVAFNEAVDAQVARDVAMQIAAMNPAGITEDDVPAEIKERELSIARDKAREAGKPENIIEHIAEGALKKYYKENTLLEQAFVKDNKVNIQQYLQAQSKTLTVTAFKRASLSAE